MSGLENLPENPASLAATIAEDVALRDRGFAVTRQDERDLVGLDGVADNLGFIGQKYFVQSHRSLSVPVSFEDSEQVKYWDFMGLTFEGEFVSYSKLVVGRIIGAGAVRALCLSFDKVTMLPYFDNIPDDHLLHVPVLAVASIDQQAA